MTDTQAPSVPRPLPAIDDLTRPFWTAANEGRLIVQRCEACGRLQFPAAFRCRACGAEAPVWTEVSGRGVVHTFTVFHRALHPAFAADVPYNVSVIELDEGPFMVSNVIGGRQPTIGMRVRVTFESISEGIKLPKFEPLDDDLTDPVSKGGTSRVGNRS